jgi:hypothetical protein
MDAMKDVLPSGIRDPGGIARPGACRWRFDARAAFGALVVFALLVLLATAGARTGWLRGFFGDVLAVVWLYLCVKAVIGARPWPLALAAVGVGCALELSQYLARLWHLRIGHPVLRILLGSTPDWMDVLAYGLGGVAVLALEAAVARRPRRRFKAVRPPACAPRWWRRGR